MTMTHADLCSLAVKWLRRPESKAGPGCNLAVSECSAADNGEIPDAIGFRSVGMEQHSVLVEVKVSRADFLVDARKPHRVDPAQGLGRFRYFLAPEGLIAANELPAGWGLIELVGRTLKVRAGHVLEKRQVENGWRRCFAAWEHPHNRDRELALLVRLFARIGDAEALQRELKIARNLLARAAKSAEMHRDRAEKAQRELWMLRQALEDSGTEPKRAIPRVIQHAA